MKNHLAFGCCSMLQVLQSIQKLISEKLHMNIDVDLFHQVDVTSGSESANMKRDYWIFLSKEDPFCDRKR